MVDELLLIVRVPVAALADVGANSTSSVTACLGLSVTGKVAPDTVKPAPLIGAELTVTAPVPLEVNVTPSVAFEPTVTSPKLRLVGLTVSCGVVVPVPLRPTATVAFVDELLLMLSVPVDAPAVVGANCTLSVNVCLGLRVAGKVAPETVNPVPPIVAELTVTGDVPLEVIVTPSVAFEPTATLPKLKEVGLIVHCGVPVPVPLRPTAAVALVDELLLMVSAPVAAAAVVGANFTLSVNVCFGFKVTGNVDPDTVNPVPLIVAELICTADVPLEVNVTADVAFEPTATLPKLSELGLTVNCGVVVLVPVPLRLTETELCLAALLAIVSAPVAALAAVGVNFTFSVTVCFGLSVRGMVAPDTLYPLPLMVAALMTSGAVPVEVTVTGIVEFEPTAILPKLRPVVLIINCGLVAVTPVLVRLIAAVAFVEELLLMVSVPVTAPAVMGADCTSSVIVCCGLRVSGKVAPDTLKPAPVSAAELIVTAAVPVEVSVTGSVEAAPTVTLPKARLAELTVNPAVPVAADTFVKYPHPEMMRIRIRKQARRYMALPHQPLYPEDCALTRAQGESKFERSQLLETRTTTSSESDGGGTQIWDTNFTSANKYSFQGQIKRVRGNMQITWVPCSPAVCVCSIRYGCSGRQLAFRRNYSGTSPA